jgi:hypothetical protein
MRQLNRAVHEAALAARIDKRVSMHTLRHSFATYLSTQHSLKLPAGVSLCDASTDSHCHRRLLTRFLHSASVDLRISPPRSFTPHRYGRRIDPPIETPHNIFLFKSPSPLATANRRSTIPRFPPLGLVRRLPSYLTGYGMLSHEGQESDNP